MNSEVERKELWRDLLDHNSSLTFQGKPWMICGDFNEFLDVEEHSLSLPPKSFAGMRDFQDVVRTCELVDLGGNGPFYTCCSRRDGDLICKRLDRVLINDVWSQDFAQAYMVFDGGGCSDHLRCRITLNGHLNQFRRPFKFSNILTRFYDFLLMVEEHWRRQPRLLISTTALFKFSKALKKLKPLLHNLGKKHLYAISEKTKAAHDDLCLAQTMTFSDPTPEVLEYELAASSRWEFLSSIEESFLRQKSKLHWLKVGDKN